MLKRRVRNHEIVSSPSRISEQEFACFLFSRLNWGPSRRIRNANWGGKKAATWGCDVLMYPYSSVWISFAPTSKEIDFGKPQSKQEEAFHPFSYLDPRSFWPNHESDFSNNLRQRSIGKEKHDIHIHVVSSIRVRSERSCLCTKTSAFS